MSVTKPPVPLRLRSPFNGESWPVPPDSTPEFIAALEARGFVRIPTVPVKASQLHTYHGQSYDVGDVYEVDDLDVETVEAQGKAFRVAQPTTPTTGADRGAYKTTDVGEQRTTNLANPKPKK